VNFKIDSYTYPAHVIITHPHPILVRGIKVR
jgi:hypothetical protein